jgi:acetylornithine deacetylase
VTDDPIALLVRLVETPSVSGTEAALVAILRDELAASGLSPVVSGRNVWCALAGKRPGRTLLFEAHIDTVPSSPQWTGDPWKARRSDGRLTGLGANDVKGGAVAMLFALRALAKDRDFAGTLLFAACCDEETGGQGLEVLRAELPRIDAAVIAEPTGLCAATAQRGLMRVVVCCEGRAAHAARPWQGVNAIDLAMADLAAVSAIAAPRANPLLGRATCTPTLVEGGTKANVVPAHCRFTLDVRPTPEHDNAWWETRIRAAVKGRIETMKNRITPVWTDPADPLVAAALAVTGRAAVGFGGVSDLFHVRDVPGIVLGPGLPEQSHVADEWIEEAQVVRAVGVYRDLAAGYLARGRSQEIN